MYECTVHDIVRNFTLSVTVTQKGLYEDPHALSREFLRFLLASRVVCTQFIYNVEEYYNPQTTRLLNF